MEPLRCGRTRPSLGMECVENSSLGAQSPGSDRSVCASNWMVISSKPLQSTWPQLPVKEGCELRFPPTLTHTSMLPNCLDAYCNTECAKPLG